MSAEDVIVAALAGVPGIEAKVDQPEVLTPGACWPVWTGALPLTMCSVELRFDVVVVLPAGAAAAAAAVRRDLLIPIIAALVAANCTVVNSAPAQLIVQSGGPPVPLLRISVTISE